MHINFRMAHNKEKNIFLKELTGKVSQSFLDEFGSRQSFSSLYLAGSLSRGEGSVIKVNNRFFLLSDFDFLLVADDEKSAKSISRQLPFFLKELNKKHQPLGLLSEIDCGVTTRGSLQAVRSKLFWYEFVKSGKFIAGNGVDLSHIQTWDYRNISAVEALILLQNRAMEQLVYLPSVFQGEDIDNEAFVKIVYLSARSFCDMAKSYLLFKGIYSDKSLERLEMVKKMGGEVLDPELIENISFWTSFKMDPCVEMVFDRFGGDWSNRNEILQKIVKSLHRGLIMLWKIEAGGIFNSPFSHIGEDIWTIKTADIRLRARAWLSYGKNELLRKRPFPLHKTPYYIMFNHTPLWVSHLAGMILYDSFFEFKKDKGRTARELSDLLFFVSQRLPNASKKDFDQSSFFNTWKHLRKKNLAIWSTVALGERKDLGFENE